MRRVFAALAAGLAIGAAALPANAGPADFRNLGAYLDGLVSNGRYPGASVLVRQDGREIYFTAVGARDRETSQPVRRDTVFRIYSMSKPITTAAVMVLVDEGRLRLDDPVEKYIPEFRGLRVYAGQDGETIRTEPARPMTVENLLTHTAGLSYGFQPGDPVAALYRKGPLAGDSWRFNPAFAGGGALARTLADLPLVAQPGDRWHYSMSLDIAALVVQRASGMSFESFLQKKLFGPLGMKDTGFWARPHMAGRLASLYGPGPGGGLSRIDAAETSNLRRPIPGFSGGGGLLSTVDDYARFGEMLLAGGVGNGRRVLSKRSVSAMMTNHLAPAQLAEMPLTSSFGLGGDGRGLGFGYGGAVVLDTGPGGGVGSVGEYAWGGAASTTFWVDPVRRVVVVFMTQVIPPGREPIRDRLRQEVYKAFGPTTGGPSPGG